MAIYRAIQTSFWTDAKVADTFSPEEKLMYLYLLTNPRTNLCGCYELSVRRAAFEIGVKKEQAEKLLEALKEKRVVAYDAGTGEVLIVNWHRYNWTLSPKFRKPLISEIKTVKHEPFRKYLEELLNRYSDDTVSIPYTYPMDTTVLFCSDSVLLCSDTVSVSDSVSVSDTVSDTVTDKPSNNDTKRASMADEFEELWKLYPRKQGKRGAFEAYKRARKDGVTDEEIRKGIEAYRDYIKISGTDPQYIKQGSTFFSQRAWADDWTPRKKNSKLDQQFEDMKGW